MVLESGDTKWFGFGVVYRDCDLDSMPGWRDGTVGYHTGDGIIFHREDDSFCKKTTGKGSNIFIKASLKNWIWAKKLWREQKLNLQL